MTMGRYILDGQTPVECEDLLKWGAWLETANRHVALTKKDGIKVSTVFLGLDHSFGGAPPILFETMIFGGKHDEDQSRYATWKEAVAGHKAMCKKAGITNA